MNIYIVIYRDLLTGRVRAHILDESHIFIYHSNNDPRNAARECMLSLSMPRLLIKVLDVKKAWFDKDDMKSPWPREMQSRINKYQ